MSAEPGAALVRAYTEAVYVVDWGRRGLRLVPGEAVPHWRTHFGFRTAAFITACNPRSERVREEANTAAMARLRERVARAGLRWLEGEGRSPRGDWPAEASLLVLGIEPAQAHRLALDFDQSALLIVTGEGVVQLEFTAPPAHRSGLPTRP